MSRVPRVLYVVCTNDKYELPLYVCDTSVELSRQLHYSNCAVSASLSRSHTGVCRTKNRKYKYYRMDSDTGEIIVGKLPKHLKRLCTTRRNKGR